MFNKNLFKEQFRAWSEQFPFASTKEIESFFNLHVPEQYRAEYSWLIEQSMEWLAWRQESLQREMLKKETQWLL